jgi:hypothetical protein
LRFGCFDFHYDRIEGGFMSECIQVYHRVRPGTS